MFFSDMYIYIFVFSNLAPGFVSKLPVTCDSFPTARSLAATSPVTARQRRAVIACDKMSGLPGAEVDVMMSC